MVLESVNGLGITHILVQPTYGDVPCKETAWGHSAVHKFVLWLQSVINGMPDLATRVEQLSMTHMLIDMPDMEEANLLPHFERIVHFIKSALDQSGKVLVHCQAGVSRSASVSPDLLLLGPPPTTVTSTLLAVGSTCIPDGNGEDRC